MMNNLVINFLIVVFGISIGLFIGRLLGKLKSEKEKSVLEGQNALLQSSQEIAENAIGLRLGDSDGFGAEISYQRAFSAFGDNNRIEANLGWRSGDNYDGFKLVGLYQWVWPPLMAFL